MVERPAPPDPFARKTSSGAVSVSGPLSETLSQFTPKPLRDAIPDLRPIGNIAPDTGTGGRARRRGDPETRSKSINFRMKPREQAALNALCDELNKSMPDTIMLLIDHYRRSGGGGGLM